MTTNHLKMEVQLTPETSRTSNINQTRGEAIQNGVSNGIESHLPYLRPGMHIYRNGNPL